MSELEWLGENELIDDEIDFESLFNFQSNDSIDAVPPIPPPSESTWQFGDLENFLMKDDDGPPQGGEEDDKLLLDSFLSDVLLLDSSASAESLSLPSPESDGKTSAYSSDPKEGRVATTTNSPADGNEKAEDIVELHYNVTAGATPSDTDNNIDELDPSVSKKRLRQLRNKDAALRSRERKKMYLKDLEMKSRRLEAECLRLGRLLQCCYAENHMLRFSLHAAQSAKQESAVLLLESLLLGSLLWCLGIMCLFPLPILLRLTQDAVLQGNVEGKDQKSVVPKGAGNELIEFWWLLSFMRSKRYRASRIKMRCCIPTPGFTIWNTRPLPFPEGKLSGLMSGALPATGFPAFKATVELMAL